MNNKYVICVTSLNEIREMESPVSGKEEVKCECDFEMGLRRQIYRDNSQD